MGQSASIRLTDVFEVDPRVDLFEVGGRPMGTDPSGRFFGLEELDVEGLRAVLALLDGTRTVGHVVDALKRRYDADDIVALIAQLDGTVLRRIAPRVSVPPGLGDASVCVLGAGRLAHEVRRALSHLGFHRITQLEARRFRSCEQPEFDQTLRGCSLVARARPDQSGASPSWSTDELRDRFAEHALVVCALEGVHGRALLDVNAAALASGTPTLFVAIQGSVCSVGPMLVPWRSPCFVCSRLSTMFKGHEGDGAQVLPFLRFGSEADAQRWAIERIVEDAAAEALRFVVGTPYPERIATLFEAKGDGFSHVVRVSAVTSCPACHGHHRGMRLDATAEPPPARLTRIAAGVRDRVGGARSFTPDTALRNAEAMLEHLGVGMECTPLGSGAPEAFVAFGCPYFFTKPEPRFSKTAPVIWSRPHQIGYGKGVTDQQARCSALFEWFERNLSLWTGDRDLVHASYRQVKDRAIDVPFLVSGLLPGLQPNETRPFHEDEPIDWVWGHCLRRDRPVLVPATAVFLGGALFRGSALEFPQPGSAGLSAGCSMGDAILQGLLEVVERDASATSLRNGVSLARIDLESIQDEAVRVLLERIASAGYEPLLLDMTSSIGIPAIAAYLLRDGEYTYHFGLGYGAHIDPDIAVRRAVTEAAQSLFFDDTAGRDDPLRAIGSFFAFYPHRRQLLDNLGDKRRVADLPRAIPPDTGVWEQIDHVVGRITTAIPGADVCVVDLTPDVTTGIHVVRTIVTGTLHEVRLIQYHIPERCRLVPVPEMYLGFFDG